MRGNPWVPWSISGLICFLVTIGGFAVLAPDPSGVRCPQAPWPQEVTGATLKCKELVDLRQDILNDLSQVAGRLGSESQDTTSRGGERPGQKNASLTESRYGSGLLRQNYGTGEEHRCLG